LCLKSENKISYKLVSKKRKNQKLRKYSYQTQWFSQYIQYLETKTKTFIGKTNEIKLLSVQTAKKNRSYTIEIALLCLQKVFHELCAFGNIF